MKAQVSGTCQEILVQLRRGGPQAAHALGRRIGVTAVAVRKHLSLLERGGLVKSATQRGPVGRPSRVYSVTNAAEDLLPAAYDAALLSMLRHIRRVGGEELLAQVLEGRLAEMQATYQERLAGTTDLASRIEAIARVREEQGYMTACERVGEDFVLAEHNCALSRAVREFPQVCVLETSLLQRALGDDVTMRCAEHILRGGHRCVFLVRPRTS